MSPGTEHVHEQLGAARAHEAAKTEHFAGARFERDVAQEGRLAARAGDGERVDDEERECCADRI